MTNSSSNDVLHALSHLQHRGRDSYGISPNSEQVLKNTGLVNNHEIKPFYSPTFIGHVRYSTTQGKEMNNDTIQPFKNSHPILGNYTLAHNGNVPNILEHAKKLNITLNSDNDTEFLVRVINSIHHNSWHNILKELLLKIKGVYCLLVLHNDTIYAIKDTYGVRPLVLVKNNEGKYAFCSESCATQDLGYHFERNIQAGEISKLDQNGLTILSKGTDINHFCWFEYIYFMRAESQINTSQTIEDYRYQCGIKMGQEDKEKALVSFNQNTIVVAMPNTAIPSAKGYSHATGILYDQAIEKIKGTGRTFILPTNKQRRIACDSGLQITPQKVNGKCIILIDDSIVRGNTLESIVHRLKFYGAKEVHARIMSPIVKSPCYYGIDIPTKEELIGYKCDSDTNKIASSLGLESLKFMNTPPENSKLCTSCFTGSYSDILEW